MAELAKYGPWAVIIGGSEGVGSCLAMRLAADGVNPLLVARKPEALAEAADAIRSAYDVEVRTLSCDIAAPDAIDAIAAAADGIDIGMLIHNVGGGFGKGLMLDNDVETSLKTLRANSEMQLRLVHHFVPAMVARGRGGVIFTGSMSGNIGSYNYAVYSAVKSFTQILAEGLWAELGQQGVDVLALVLGSTDTPARRRSGVKDAPGMHVADPDDVAALALAELGKGPVALPPENREFFQKANSMDRREAAEMLRNLMIGIQPD